MTAFHGWGPLGVMLVSYLAWDNDARGASVALIFIALLWRDATLRALRRKERSDD